MKKKLVSALCFVAVAGLVTGHYYDALKWKETEGITSFYEKDRNTADVVFMGSSHCYCTINPTLLWEDYGMAAVSLTESGQNLGTTYYYMKEMYKTQKPKVVAVELTYTYWNYGGLLNGNMYRNTLGMKYSLDYLENMVFTHRNASSQGITKDYYKYIALKFPVFHSRYNELTEADFNTDLVVDGQYRGSWKVDENIKTPKPVAEGYTEADEELNSYYKGWLDKFVALAEEHDTQLVFFVAPFNVNYNSMKRFNTVKAYSEERGIPFFNYNELYQEIGFDYSTDMRETSHLNNYGAQKVTEHLGSYIHENYELEDRRGDARYGQFDEQLKKWDLYENEHAIREESDPDAFLQLIDSEDYEYAIQTFDDAALPQSITDKMQGSDLYLTAQMKHGTAYLSDDVVVRKNGEEEQLYIDRELITREGDKSQFWITVTEKESGELVEAARFTLNEDGTYSKSDAVEIIETEVNAG